MQLNIFQTLGLHDRVKHSIIRTGLYIPSLLYEII